MPLDPQIVRDLDADRIREEPLPPLLDRLVYMGISLAPGQAVYSVKFPKVIQESYIDFRRRLLWRPWNTVLIRKDEAHRTKLRWLHFELETIAVLGSTSPAGFIRNLQRLIDIAEERRALLGWDWPQEPFRRPGRRGPP
jgi:hypothetical protein